MADPPHVSNVNGVCYHKRNNEWRVNLHDRLASSRNEKPDCFQATFSTREEAEQACVRKRTKLDLAFDLEIYNRWKADASLQGLARAPADFAKADPKTAYWHAYQRSRYVPYRVVKSGKTYRAACVECDPTNVKLAVLNSDGTRTLCIKCSQLQQFLKCH